MRIATREVLLDGQPRYVEPRPFDMLVYLIRHRERVVPKSELLDQLWPHEFVSPSVIARAVMKARQAIGDDGDANPLIKTVHGIGYRFIGDLLPEEAGPADAQAAPQHTPSMSAPEGTAAPDTVGLVLLPFENHTGQGELDWIELGLMSMVVKALAADTRLRVPAMSSLLAALGPLPPKAPFEDRVDAVQRLLGARHIVHAAIAREGDQYALDYRVAPDMTRRRLLGPELTRLGQRLAWEVVGAVLGEQAAAAPVGYGSTDPLANQAMARALQAAAEQKWKVAANLIKVVLDIEPLNTQARLEYLRVLVPQGDEAASAVGAGLLAQARTTGDHRLEISTLQELGRACSKKSLHHAAKEHLNEALRLAELHGLGGEKAASLRQLSVIAISEHDFPEARRCLDAAEAQLDTSGDQLERLSFLVNAALVARKLGDPVGAVHLGLKAARLNREHRRPVALASALLNLVYPCVDLGLMREAVDHGEEALATARAAQNSLRAALATESLCWLYRELRSPKQSSRILEQAGVPDDASPVLHGEILRARAHHAACEGAHAQAADFLRQAIAIYRQVQAGSTEDTATPLMVISYLHDAMPSLIVSLILSGRLEEASAALAEAPALPDFAADTRLQAALEYCRALMAHAQGSRAEAQRILTSVADTAPLSLWRAYACLDGAWLAIEAGEPGVAHKLLRDLGPWLREHPAGMMVDARYKYATGHYAAAREAHRRHASRIESALPSYCAELGRLYDDAAQGAPQAPAAIVPAPRLPTVL